MLLGALYKKSHCFHSDWLLSFHRLLIMPFLELLLLTIVIVAIAVGLLNQRPVKPQFDIRKAAHQARLKAIMANQKTKKSKPIQSPQPSPAPKAPTKPSIQLTQPSRITQVPTNRPVKPTPSSLTPKAPTHKPRHSTIQPQQQVTWQVKNKAHSLLDKKTLKRLLSTYRLKYPGQTEQWLWEKIIWDLERDRFR